MRTSRKIALGVAAVVLVVPLLLVVLGFAFRGRIAARVQREVARSVDARVRWARADVSLLRDFPNVGVRLDDLSVIGVKRFAGDTLIAMRQFGLVLDLGSVIRSLRSDASIVVRRLELRRPVARLRVLEDGAASWDIFRASAGTAARSDTGGALALSLRNLIVREGDIVFQDRRSDLDAALVGLDITLDGDFAKEQFTLATAVRSRETSLRFAGVPYLSRAALSLDTDIAADTRRNRYTFARDQLKLNALALDFAGSLGFGDDRTALDLTFSSPSTDFAHILSLVPAVYGKDFAKLQTTGRMSLAGRVRGDYGEHAFPALDLKARVENGAFRYPDLPLPVRDIAFELAVSNPGGHVDSTVVRLDRLHLSLNNRPVDARLVLRSPVSDPDVDLALKGSMDLADLRRAVKMEDVQELAGLLAADVALRTRKSWADAGQYERIAASGTLDLSRVALRTAALPHPLAVDSARLRFTPRRVEMPALVARIGRSNVSAAGSLDNLLGFLLRDEALRGDARVASSRVDLNEWTSSDDTTQIIEVPPGVDFTLQAAVDQVLYGKLQIANARGGLRVKDGRVTLDRFRMDMLGGTVVADGFYETTAPKRPTFALSFAVDTVDIPAAFASLLSVQRLAPIARYARGRTSTKLDAAGVLGANMTPLFDVLTGRGTMNVDGLAIEGFPAFVKLADALKLEALRNPTMRTIGAAFRIENGRVHFSPFDAHVGDLALTISGSSGIDQTIDYDLALTAPTALLPAGATQAITGLARRAGRAGINLGDASVVSIAADVTGTVTSPVVRPTFTGTAGSVRESVQQAVQAEADRRRAELEARADSATLEARRRASAEAERLVAAAEERAAVVRREADSLAARVRREAGARADSLVARTTNPAAKIAATAAANRVKREADTQAAKIVREADEKAKALVDEARRQGQALVPPGS